MKNIVQLFVLIFFISCTPTIQYDGEKKLVTKGRILDENNNPIANLEIRVANEINTSNNSNFFSFNSDQLDYQEIGIARTNSNGEFLILNPAPINEDQTLVLINPSLEAGKQNVNFFNILKSDYKNFKLDISTIKVYKTNAIINVTILYNTQNVQHRIVKIKFIGSIAPTNISYNTAINFQPDEILFLNKDIQVVKNQTLIIEYTVLNTNTNQTEVLQKEVIVGDQNQIFNLNY